MVIAPADHEIVCGDLTERVGRGDSFHQMVAEVVAIRHRSIAMDEMVREARIPHEQTLWVITARRDDWMRDVRILVSASILSAKCSRRVNIQSLFR